MVVKKTLSTRNDPEAAPVIANGTESAGRVADVLSLFVGDQASFGVSEAARRVGLSKAVVYRIFQSLATRRFLEIDPESRAYRLGPALAALGARAFRDLDLRACARPILVKLRDETCETATLSQVVGDRRIYVDQVEGPQTIRMTVELGSSHPLYAGGSGKAILAFLPAAEREKVVAKGLARLTGSTITDADALAADLAEVAERGYAMSRGERQAEAGSVAAPVFGVHGNVLGAVSVCGPLGRFGDDEIQGHVPRLREAAVAVSRAMGWEG